MELICVKNFKQWCMENKAGSLLELYENADNEYESDEIGFSSKKHVNWKCKKCSIEWEQSLITTTKKSNKECPYCTHKRPSSFYNLTTEYPELEQEWNYELNLKAPTEYLPKSAESVWWKCKNGHVWKNIIEVRVKAVKSNIKNGRPICPYCNHEKVSFTYNLLTEFPNYAKQWNYIKNGSITPLNVSPKSRKKVWWICEYDSLHTWQDRISNRTALHRGCPECSRKFKNSFPSRVLYYYLKQYFYDCEMEFKILGKYIADIYIPQYKIIIEYDGWYYHSNLNSKQRENKKDQILKERGFCVIRIKDRGEEIQGINYRNGNFEYHLQENYNNLDELVKEVINVIGKMANANIRIDINHKRDYQKIEDTYYHIRKSNSLAVKRPEFIEEWSSNNNISPDNVSISYQDNVKWICKKCNREYKATVYNRVKNNSNCPFCANKKVCEDNSLAKCSPRLIKEWDNEKNGDLTPNDVTNGSDKKVWWICEKGHSWQAHIYSRTGKKKTNCPECSKNNRKRKGEQKFEKIQKNY